MSEAVPAAGIVQDIPGRAVPGAVQGTQLLGDAGVVREEEPVTTTGAPVSPEHLLQVLGTDSLWLWELGVQGEDNWKHCQL